MAIVQAEKRKIYIHTLTQHFEVMQKVDYNFRIRYVHVSRQSGSVLPFLLFQIFSLFYARSTDLFRLAIKFEAMLHNLSEFNWKIR